MKVTVSGRGVLDMEVTIEEIPNEGKLTSLDINFQDMAVNLYYEGWKPVSYPMLEVEGEVTSADASRQIPPRYDGELDPPGMDLRRQPEGGYRPGASAPQA
jgi:hypothetical protein